MGAVERRRKVLLKSADFRVVEVEDHITMCPPDRCTTRSLAHCAARSALRDSMDDRFTKLQFLIFTSSSRVSALTAYHERCYAVQLGKGLVQLSLQPGAMYRVSSSLRAERLHQQSNLRRGGLDTSEGAENPITRVLCVNATILSC